MKYDTSFMHNIQYLCILHFNAKYSIILINEVWITCANDQLSKHIKFRRYETSTHIKYLHKTLVLNLY
jgi:hypothetical protein